MTRIEMSSTEIQRDLTRALNHIENGDEIAVVRWSRRVALITAYPDDEPASTTLAELADSLDTTIYVLMEFAPDDVTRNMTGGTEIPADVENMIREAWANSPGSDD